MWLTAHNSQLAASSLLVFRHKKDLLFSNTIFSLQNLDSTLTLPSHNIVHFHDLDAKVITTKTKNKNKKIHYNSWYKSDQSPLPLHDSFHIDHQMKEAKSIIQQSLMTKKLDQWTLNTTRLRCIWWHNRTIFHPKNPPLLGALPASQIKHNLM